MFMYVYHSQIGGKHAIVFPTLDGLPWSSLVTSLLEGEPLPQKRLREEANHEHGYGLHLPREVWLN